MIFLKNIFKYQKITKTRTFNSLIYLALLIALFTVSACSDDGDNFTPSASDVVTTIDENPNNGTTIGTVATNLTGTLNYTITSQSATGAFSINATSGVVTVNDATLFDYETSTMLTAQVSVTNSSDTAISMVEVTLNNIDDIASFLSASRSEYQNANDGDWILITEEEYDNLFNNLNEVSKVGTTDEEFDTDALQGNNAFTVGNNNGATIPSGGYLIAFRYKSYGDGASDSKVKISSPEVTGTYANLGNPLPLHTSGIQHFVLKGNQTALTDIGHLGFYEATGIGFSNVPESSYFAPIGDVDTVTLDTGILIHYQGIASTQKQWD